VRCIFLSALFIVLLFSTGIGQDKIRGNHYEKAREFWKTKNRKSALSEARLAVAASKSVQEKAEAILFLVKVQMSLQMTASAMDSIELGLSLPLNDFPLEQARLYQVQGGQYLRRGQIKEAREALLKATDIAQEAGIADSVSRSFNMLGVVYNIEGNNATSLFYFNRFLDILSRNPDSNAISMANVNIGTIHLGLKEYEQAEKSFGKARTIEMENGQPEDLAEIYRSLSSIYTAKGDHQRAKLYLDSALVTPLGPDNTAGKLITLAKLVKVFENLGQFKKALSTLKVKIGLEKPVPNVQAINDWNLANLLDKNDQQDSVDYLYQRSIQLADSGNFQNTLQQARLHYWQWLKKRRRFEEALATHEAYVELKFEMNKAESEKMLAQERARFEVVEAKSELKDANQENVVLQETNTLYIGLLVALGILLLAVLFLLLMLQKARQKLKHQNQQLVELVVTKNKFFSIIAHDIRSPLIAFQSIGKRIQKAHQIGNSDKVTLLSNQLDESATQLNGLLNNLLSWALLQNGLLTHRPESLSAEEVIIDNLDLFEDLARMKNISLEHHLQDGLTVFADENALHLMIRNLISNAIKFSPEGSKISVRAFNRKEETVIEVKDTGPGIPKNKLNEIFSIRSGGERGTAGEKGVGLGLHLVSELMRAHSGKVWADTEVGKGAKFTLVFQN